MPRASYRVRSVESERTLEHQESPSTFHYGGHTYPFAATLRGLSESWDYAYRWHGMWECVGERQSATGGMKGIEFLSGFQSSARGLIRASDAIGNRTPLDCCDSYGVPMLLPKISDGYDDRGWAKSTQIAKVCKPHSASIYDDRRIANEWNQGSCTYHDDILGYERDNGELPANQEHGVRTESKLLAAANCGDESARDDLDMYANDSLLAWPQPPIVNSYLHGAGSAYYGTRSAAWRTRAWQLSQRTAAQANAFIPQFINAKMVNHFVQNVPATYPFSPTPIECGIAADKRVFQVMEHEISLCVLGDAGRLDLVREGCRAIFDSTFVRLNRYVPKFGVVADSTGHIVSEVTEWAGGPGFFDWTLLGCLAALDPDATDWRTWACSINYPGKNRPATTLHELAGWMRTYDPSNVTRSQTVMLLSVVEYLGLG